MRPTEIALLGGFARIGVNEPAAWDEMQSNAVVLELERDGGGIVELGLHVELAEAIARALHRAATTARAKARANPGAVPPRFRPLLWSETPPDEDADRVHLTWSERK